MTVGTSFFVTRLALIAILKLCKIGSLHFCRPSVKTAFSVMNLKVTDHIRRVFNLIIDCWTWQKTSCMQADNMSKITSLYYLRKRFLKNMSKYVSKMRLNYDHTKLAKFYLTRSRKIKFFKHDFLNYRIILP